MAPLGLQYWPTIVHNQKENTFFSEDTIFWKTLLAYLINN